jgi:hypothetical protein
VLAFLAGWPHRRSGLSATASSSLVRSAPLIAAPHGRSQMLLVERPMRPRRSRWTPKERSRPKSWGANQLYCATTVRRRAGQRAEELERLFLEVAHSPEQLRPQQLARLQRRIESRGLLFKVRVLESTVRQQQKQEQPAIAGSIS